tara:strand:+ start:464 stop:661 length:198 start_codon:yes stop_codon:yes gene_type:complete
MSVSAGPLSQKRPVTRVIAQQKAKANVAQESGPANSTGHGVLVRVNSSHRPKIYATEKTTIAMEV